VVSRWLRPGEVAGHGGWDIWRLREVGGWGDAGRIVGLRWEEVGGEAARALLGDGLVPLWTDRALGRWLGTVGLPNADAILAESGADAVLTLRSVDLKWTIDTADYSQISGETLRRLVEKAGERLASLLPGRPADWRYGDGLFVAPDRPLNRLFLRSRANVGREYPIEAREVRWVDVDPVAFFGVLPGWAFAVRLAELERGEPARDLETAERYFFLGVGVRGALAAAERSLFAEREGSTDAELVRFDADLDGRLLVRLDELVATRGVRDARSIVRALSGGQRERQELRQRLRALERPAYRFPDLVEDARKAGRDASTDPEVEQALRATYRDIAREHALWIRTRGRELVAEGLPDAAALDQVGAERDSFKRRVRAAARATLTQAFPPG
jgi:hypothetical protein